MIYNQKALAIINLYPSDNRVEKYMKQKLKKLKEQIYNSTTFRDWNTLISINKKRTREKATTDIEDLKKTY